MSATATTSHTPQELRDALRQFERALRQRHLRGRLPQGGLTERGYAHWAAAQSPPAPSAQEQRAAHQGSWSLALQAAGLRCSGKPPEHITAERAETHLRAALALAGERGRNGRLSEDDYDAYRAQVADAPHRELLKRAFGPSWSAVVRSVGVAPAWEPHSRQQGELMLRQLWEQAEKFGRAPSRSEWERLRGAGTRSAFRYGQVFGSWTAAIERAGLEPTYPAITSLAARLRVAEGEAGATRD